VAPHCMFESSIYIIRNFNLTFKMHANMEISFSGAGPTRVFL